MGGVLLLDQSLPKTAIDERLCNCHENRQHGNQAKFFREKQAGQDDGDEKLDSLLTEAF